jgi:hypothetical protein
MRTHGLAGMVRDERRQSFEELAAHSIQGQVCLLLIQRVGGLLIWGERATVRSRRAKIAAANSGPSVLSADCRFSILGSWFGNPAAL